LKHKTTIITITTFATINMQSTILRSVRLAGQAASHVRATPFASQPYYLSTRLPAPIRSRIATRWYSDEKSKDENLGASGNTKEEPTVEGGAKQTPENPLQKELETAKKEAVDLKVRRL
jgi:hypothetical protein